MNTQEYEIYSRKYAILESIPAEADLTTVLQLQDVALRAFVQEAGYELLWNEETTARIMRQATLSRLLHHAK